MSKNSVRFNHLLMALAWIDICFIASYSGDIVYRVWVTPTNGFRNSIDNTSSANESYDRMTARCPESPTEYNWLPLNKIVLNYLLTPFKTMMLSCSIYMVVAISAERLVLVIFWHSINSSCIKR